MIVFTDHTGKEIQRFIGYEADTQKSYEALIQKYAD
jgi:hypothetical protein